MNPWLVPLLIPLAGAVLLFLFWLGLELLKLAVFRAMDKGDEEALDDWIAEQARRRAEQRDDTEGGLTGAAD